MPLEIAHLEKQGIPILRLKGHLTSGEADQLLREVIRQGVAARRSRLVIDLAGVDKIDSAGLASLLFARAQLGKLGGGLAVANLHRSPRVTLKITQLEAVLNVFGSELDAVNSLTGERNALDYDFEKETAPIETSGPFRNWGEL